MSHIYRWSIKSKLLIRGKQEWFPKTMSRDLKDMKEQNRLNLYLKENRDPKQNLNPKNLNGRKSSIRYTEKD